VGQQPAEAVGLHRGDDVCVVDLPTSDRD
jgi:hypothetical protein